MKGGTHNGSAKAVATMRYRDLVENIKIQCGRNQTENAFWLQPRR